MQNAQKPAVENLPQETLACLRSVHVIRTKGGVEDDWTAAEVPVALVYNGISHAVMMCLPKDLEVFAVGFSLAEGIVKSASEIYDVEVFDGCSGGKEVRITVSSEAFFKLKEHRRSMTGRTGCGICGTESLAGAVKKLPKLEVTQTFDLAHLQKGLSYLPEAEVIGTLTGCTHSAVWVNPDGLIALCAEDVGRHVALDKLLGMRAKAGITQGALFISSRASYEMVQKAAACGIEIMFAVSAPTALAVDMARECGVTLLAFCRSGGANVYSHPERLIGL